MATANTLEKIKKARKVMRHYCYWASDSNQEGLTDILTDLMHWAAYFDSVDFDAALSMATDHYSEEKS